LFATITDHPALWLAISEGAQRAAKASPTITSGNERAGRWRRIDETPGFAGTAMPLGEHIDSCF
jgi:hypothetical protein